MFSLDCFNDEGKVLSFDGKQDQSNVRCELRGGSNVMRTSEISFCFVEIPMYGYDPVSIWNVLRHQLLRIVGRVGIISLPIVARVFDCHFMANLHSSSLLTVFSSISLDHSASLLTVPSRIRRLFVVDRSKKFPNCTDGRIQ